MDPHASIDTKYSLVFVDLHSNTSRTSMLNHWTEQKKKNRKKFFFPLHTFWTFLNDSNNRKQQQQLSYNCLESVQGDVYDALLGYLATLRLKIFLDIELRKKSLGRAPEHTV